jgi:hypothetical protein
LLDWQLEISAAQGEIENARAAFSEDKNTAALREEWQRGKVGLLSADERWRTKFKERLRQDAHPSGSRIRTGE